MALKSFDIALTLMPFISCACLNVASCGNHSCIHMEMKARGMSHVPSPDANDVFLFLGVVRFLNIINQYCNRHDI